MGMGGRKDGQRKEKRKRGVGDCGGVPLARARSWGTTGPWRWREAHVRLPCFSMGGSSDTDGGVSWDGGVGANGRSSMCRS